MPAVISRVVVLPQPDGPSSATSSPSRISRSSASTAVTAPKRRVSFSSRTSIAPLPLHAATVNLQQLLLREQEQEQHRQDVVQPDGGQQPVVHEAPLAQQRPHQQAERRL